MRLESKRASNQVSPLIIGTVAITAHTTIITFATIAQAGELHASEKLTGEEQQASQPQYRNKYLSIAN